MIPEFVKMILDRLKGAGYEAYIVGGAVRDMVKRRPVSDWDIATSAKAEGIKRIFQDKSFFSLKHETVTLVDNGRHYEVTPFKSRQGNGTLEEDLGYRDFTVNAMAYDPAEDRTIDPYGGREDITGKLVRAVGNPRDRFVEDPIRLLRAVRVATELGFKVEAETLSVMTMLADQIAAAAKERIRDEMMRILLCPKPSTGFNLMKRTALLDVFLPELLEGYGKRQNPRYHRYTVYKHIMATVDQVEAEPVLRLTALLHDIAKPRVREKIAGTFRFYGHEEASAALAGEIMTRFRFSKEMTGLVTHLVRHHEIMYESKWGDSAIRRLIRRVGRENMDRLLAFRKADLLAHGIDGVHLNLISELEERVEKIIRGPLALKARDLEVDGNTVMEIMKLSPGREVGKALDHLMEQVMDHPDWNTRERLVALLKAMRN
ncbi:MAG: CCA tRNA nucleotidyltransferase [Desulfatiglandales bacterium]